MKKKKREKTNRIRAGKKRRLKKEIKSPPKDEKRESKKINK